MNLYLRFLRYARPYGHLALAASICFVASRFLGAYPIQLFKRAVDVAVEDVGAVAGGFMGPLTRLAGELTQLAWALFFLVRIDPALTAISLAVAPPLGYAVYRFGDRMRVLAGRYRVAQSRLWSFLAENILEKVQRTWREEKNHERHHLGLQADIG